MNYHSTLAKMAPTISPVYTADRGRSFTPTDNRSFTPTHEKRVIGTLIPSQKRSYNYQTFRDNQIENHKVEIIQQHFFPNRVNTVLTTTDQKHKRPSHSPLESTHTRTHVSPMHTRHNTALVTRHTMSPLDKRPLDQARHHVSPASHFSQAPPTPKENEDDYKAMYYKLLSDKNQLEQTLQKKQMTILDLQQKLNLESNSQSALKLKANEERVQQQADELRQVSQKAQEQEELIQRQKENIRQDQRNAAQRQQQLSVSLEKYRHNCTLLQEENVQLQEENEMLKQQLAQIKEDGDTREIDQLVRKGERSKGDSIFDLQIIQNENEILRKQVNMMEQEQAESRVRGGVDFEQKYKESLKHMLLVSMENERLINVLQMVQGRSQGQSEGERDTLRLSVLERENLELHRQHQKDSQLIRSQKHTISQLRTEPISSFQE